ncbi:MAG: hypothetical protein GF346_11035 [Candidatus Eisenbacteria bacterium]|nr:hypothetical protein [Candidatus Latescibacterota bacterium]MBD3302972.1 hypothetical protein [Candidatus Eisenbacteria bacterium]
MIGGIVGLFLDLAPGLAAGFLGGAGTVLLVAGVRPGWLGLARRVVVEKELAEIREDLVGEIARVDASIRRRPDPIRLTGRTTPADGRRRVA